MLNNNSTIKQTKFNVKRYCVLNKIIFLIKYFDFKFYKIKLFFIKVLFRMNSTQRDELK